MPGGILGSSKNSVRSNQGSSRPSMQGGSGGILGSSKNSVRSQRGSEDLSVRSRIESNEVPTKIAMGSVPALVVPGTSPGICNSRKNSQKGLEDLSGRSATASPVSSRSAQRPQPKTPPHKGSATASTPASGRSAQRPQPKAFESADFSKMDGERAGIHSAGQIEYMATLSPGQGSVLNKKESRANPVQSVKPKSTTQSRGNQMSKQVSANAKSGILPDDAHNIFSPEELDGVLHEPLFESSPPDPNADWEAASEKMRKEIQRFQRRGKAELIALKAEFFNTLMLQEDAQRKNAELHSKNDSVGRRG